MFDITATDRWHRTFPGGRIGLLLVSGVDNAPRPTPLDTRKHEIETRLRERFAGASREELRELDVLRAYRDHYRRFGNTYHLLGQLESIVRKGRSLPSVSPLVDAVFAAEMETLVLTAGHDADRLEPPLTIDATRDDETFRQMNGRERRLAAGDMAMRDGAGIVCTILFGQDPRTPISPRTRRALYVAYAPAGVAEEAVQRQLETIHEHVRLFAPTVEVEGREVVVAEGDGA